MVEASFQDLVFGTVLLAFDGRVVERFVPHLNTSHRLHATHVNVRVQQPDHKGNWRVEFRYRDGSHGGFDAVVGDAGYSAIHPLLTELGAAGVPFLD